MTRRKSHAPLRVMPPYQKHHAPLSIPIFKEKPIKINLSYIELNKIEAFILKVLIILL